MNSLASLFNSEVSCALAVAVLAGNIILFAVLLRRMPFRTRMVLMLFPLSQLGIVAPLALFLTVNQGQPSTSATLLGLTLCCLGVNVLLLRQYGKNQRGLMLQEKVELLERQVHAQEAYLRHMEDGAKQAQGMVDAMVAVCREAREAMDSDDRDEAMERVLGQARTFRERINCENKLVDAITMVKGQECARMQVAVEWQLNVPEDTGISPADLCGLFVNLLDNGIKAASGAPEGSRCLLAKSAVRGTYLTVKVQNTFAMGREGERRPLSLAAKARSKERVTPEDCLSEHGWGMDILQRIAESHGGCFHFREMPFHEADEALLRMGKQREDVGVFEAVVTVSMPTLREG